MSPNDQAIFWQLGRDARTGGALPHRYRCAREVATRIHEDLSAVGLTGRAIRRVGCALLEVSVNRRGSDAPPDCQTGGGRQR
jgi:hypothetical protein